MKIGKVNAIDSKGCMLKTDDSKLLVVKGLKDFIVASHKNAVIICPREDEQEIKNVVNNLRKNNEKDYF